MTAARTGRAGPVQALLDAGAGSLVLAAAACTALARVLELAVPPALALVWGPGVEAAGWLALGTRLQPDTITARAGNVQASRCIKSRCPYTSAARKWAPSGSTGSRTLP